MRRASFRVLPSHFNILNVIADIHVCPVNCQPGVMGKGVAKTFADEFQGLRARHARLCQDRLLRPGRPSLLYGLTRDRWEDSRISTPMMDLVAGTYNVVLFPTKDRWQEPSEIQWIWNGLGALLDILLRNDNSNPCHIVYPSLGCGLGGLNFGDVMPVMKAWAGCLSEQFEITVIEPRKEKP
jgi:hypothetical protein